MPDPLSPDSARLLHLGHESAQPGDPVAPQITPAATFVLPGDPGDAPYGYGRSETPGWEAAEAALSHLEGAPALLFPSGMAAISAALMAVVKAGDRVLMPSDGYYTPRSLAERFLAGFGVETVTRPTARFAEGGFEGFAAVLIESPSNPGLELVDLAAVTAAVRAAGGVSIVDNTTMTPFGQRPLELGADLLIASDTKAPGGQSDLLLGHVAGRDSALMARVLDWRTLSGAIPSPFAAWLLHRALMTLELRFARMCETAEVLAEVLAEALAGRPGLAVCYPGLADHPGHRLAAKQMQRFGSLIGLTLASAEAAEGFIARCPLIAPATSFGAVYTSAERRARWGDAVAPGFVRLSVGTEPAEALVAAVLAAVEG